MSRIILLILCWILALPSALVSLLILLPAPNFTLFMVGVGATSWCVWLTLIGIISGLCGAFVLRMGQSWWALAGIALSLITIVISIIPTISAFNVAAREHVDLSLSRFLFGSTHGPDVHEEHDIVFDSTNHLRLDIYSNHSGQSMPAVIVIHGGSWRAGEKRDYPAFNRWLVSLGYVVFDIEYRLADDANRFPAQLEDVMTAIGWVKRNSDRYHLHPDRIALLGRSAGGQLALRAAYGIDDTSIEPGLGVQAAISFYGPTDLVWGYHNPQHPDVIHSQEVLENYIGTTPDSADGKRRYEVASPVSYVDSGRSIPPTLFIHGGRDQVVSDHHVDLILPKLKQANVLSEYLYLPWENHGFDVNFNGWGSQIAQAKVREFLDRYVKNAPGRNSTIPVR